MFRADSGVGGTPPPVSAEAEARLERQLQYYFSDKNLWRDDWLMQHLGPDATGWVRLRAGTPLAAP